MKALLEQNAAMAEKIARLEQERKNTPEDETRREANKKKWVE